MSFVHLHVHSQFSLLDGTMTPEQVARAAKTHGMSAIALTDTCNFYGAVTFYKACKSEGIKAIFGAELHVDPQGMGHDDPREADGGYQMLALVQDARGYANICELITAAIFDGVHYKPRVDLERLRRHSEGLIFLTGGRKGAFGRPLLRDNEAEARRQVHELADFLGADQLYFELQDHGLEGQERVNDFARELAQELGYLTVVTNAVHYAKAEDAVVHETLNAIGMGCSLSDVRRQLSATDQAWLKSEEELRAIFPNDEDAITRTAAIAQRCNYSLALVKTNDDYHFPATQPPDVDPDGTQPDTDANWEYFYRAFPPPRDYGLPDPEVAIPPRPPGAGCINGFFFWYAETGLTLRLKHIDPALYSTYHERLATELRTIVGMGFPAYLLIVAEFINWSKDNNIPVGPGRGSAAGSLVAWAMRITDIDPIRFDLLFERFLNPERVSMPDIDVDFCQDRREEAIEHVRQKYGAPLVSQIITYGKLKAKAAVRDVARVLDLNFNDADRIAKLIPDKLGITLQEALDETPALEALRQGDPKVRRVLDLALRVEGLCRQTGVHAAGVVVADKPLVNYAPLYRDEPGGGPVVQYDMKSAEAMGLIKFDFLGLKTLDQIRDALVSIERNFGEKLDMALIPLDDTATYELLSAGDTLGVFQLESSGMRDLLARLQPNVIDDIVALVALYRPGPLTAGMTDDFVDRKRGRKKVEYLHPSLEPILNSTYGTVVYQEQVMQIAQVLSGYSLGGADLLRRAMGKKNPAEMEKERNKFVPGAVARGVDGTLANEIFDLLAMFAAYGFNKSHSAAYGIVSYQTAFLKARYRAEYMAALMTIEAGNTDKVLMYIDDCRAHGVEVLPVSINISVNDFYVPQHEPGTPSCIRYGFAAVKGIGRGAIDAIVEARQDAGGHFDTPFAFFERVDGARVNRRVLEALVKAGAFDYSGVPRASLMAGLESAVQAGQRVRDDRSAGQVGLFAALAPTSRPAAFRFPEVPPWSIPTQLAAEHEVLGLYLTGHPMQAFRADADRYATSTVEGLNAQPDGGEVRVLGLVADIKPTRTKRGDRMAQLRVEDATGSVRCVFFPEPWAHSQRSLKSGEPVLVTAKVSHDNEAPELRGSTAEALSDLRARSVRAVRFRVPLSSLAGERLQQFAAFLQEQRGSAEALLVLLVDGRYALEVGLPFQVDPSMALEEAALKFFGQPVVEFD